jgi:small basic protein
MAVDSSMVNSASRDAYWQATQAELSTAQRRGDMVSLVGLVLIAALLWFLGDSVGMWAAGIASVALAVVAIPQLFVARRKRRISAARGLNCQHCGYVPHHTEISEVAVTRECRVCEKSLS